MKTVVEEIKDRLPIAEVLSSYITLEQSGSQYKAKCPFHNERTASFSVSPERGLYYCFGCGAKGDIFTFVSEFEGLDFRGTLKLLAGRAGVNLGSYDGKKDDTDPLYEALERATLKYQRQLTDTPSAIEYLTKRGVTKESIETFRLGYAPDEWRFIEHDYQTKDTRAVALKVGLLKETEGKVYDRFRKRIIFPFADGGGRVIGFSGRIFPDDGSSAKYLNSPETPLFQKSHVLFGFDKAKIHIKKHNFAILVEGQMDLVMSHQAGFKNTVATSGTAVSEEVIGAYAAHLAIISRMTPHLFLAFDGDTAGQKAMDRAALVALSLGMNPKVVRLPEGVDPADYLKDNGPEAWKERLKESKHFIAHHLDIIRAEKLSPHVFVAKIKKVLFPFLARVPSQMERALYVGMIAQDTGLSVQDITGELQVIERATLDAQKEPSTNTRSATGEQDVSHYERLVAMRSIFPIDAVERAILPLDTLAVAEYVFSAPSVDEATLAKAGALVERECGTLSDEARAAVAQDLFLSVKNRFLKEARHHFSALLHQQEGNQEEETRILKVLTQINQDLQAPGTP